VRGILNKLQEVLVDSEENEALLCLGLYRLPGGSFPASARWPSSGDYDGAVELNQDLNILLSGLAAHLPRTPRRDGASC
jgi:hypothetical protein